MGSLVLVSELNCGLGLFALTERLRNRMDRRVFPYSASINSLKKESWMDFSSDT